ncbi:threonine/serine exporter family protein [Streptacidiphilus monticola]
MLRGAAADVPSGAAAGHPVGGVSWAVFGVLGQARVSTVLATGVAAMLIGLFGQMLSRYQYASSKIYVTPALGPLLPGSVIYRGLLSLAQGDALQGLVFIARASALALALAVGVNLGGELARLFLKIPHAGGEAGLVRRAAKRTRGF